jgi:hypothetical protein
MSDQRHYRDDSTQQVQYPVEDSSWTRPATESVRLVKLDRPVYTGMMLGFGLAIASIIFMVIGTIIFGVLGIVLGGVVSGVTAP